MSELFADSVEVQLSQGDVFAPDWDSDRAEPIGSVIILSEGCEIDKSPTVLVSALVPVADTEAGLLANIRGNRVWRALLLEELLPSVWVDYRNTRPVDVALLMDRIERRQRSMTGMGRRLLCGKMASFLLHELPPPARYFRDGQGLVWDVWAVTPKHLAQVENQVRGKPPSEIAAGWLVFVSSLETRRLFGIPEAWQYMTETELASNLRKARPATPEHQICALAETRARPS